jgi:acetyltransferase-like isoleucine patch superfamily enzyme
MVTYGDYTYGQFTVMDYGNGGDLKVWKFCSIGRGATVILGGEHHTDWVSTYPFPAFPQHFPEAKDITGYAFTKGDVVIGNDVWVGLNVLINSGVTVGDGAVLGAGCVVTKDVDPYTVVAGNPARVIRKRFDPEIVEYLLRAQWWDWPIEKIRETVHTLCSPLYSHQEVSV